MTIILSLIALVGLPGLGLVILAFAAPTVFAQLLAWLLGSTLGRIVLITILFLVAVVVAFGWGSASGAYRKDREWRTNEAAAKVEAKRIEHKKAEDIEKYMDAMVRKAKAEQKAADDAERKIDDAPLAPLAGDPAVPPGVPGDAPAPAPIPTRWPALLPWAKPAPVRPGPVRRPVVVPAVGDDDAGSVLGRDDVDRLRQLRALPRHRGRPESLPSKRSS